MWIGTSVQLFVPHQNPIFLSTISEHPFPSHLQCHPFRFSCMNGFISGIALLICWWIWLSLCQCYTFFYKNLFFNWSIVDLQCCVNFWCTAKWFSYTYIYIFSFIFFSIMVYYRILNIVPLLYSRTLLSISKWLFSL